MELKWPLGYLFVNLTTLDVRSTEAASLPTKPLGIPADLWIFQTHRGAREAKTMSKESWSKTMVAFGGQTEAVSPLSYDDKVWEMQ